MPGLSRLRDRSINSDCRTTSSCEWLAICCTPDAFSINACGSSPLGTLRWVRRRWRKKTKSKMYDIYDEQVDVVSKAFLGLTIPARLPRSCWIRSSPC
jgi:hypothetical protein